MTSLFASLRNPPARGHHHRRPNTLHPPPPFLDFTHSERSLAHRLAHHQCIHMACLSACHLPSMSSARILLSLFCEQLSAHPAPSGASLLDAGSAWRFSVRVSSRARSSYRVLGLRLFHASVIQAFSCFRPVHLQFCLIMRHLVTCIFRGPMRACLCTLRSSLLRFSSLVALSHTALFGFMLLDFRLRTEDLAVVAPMVLFGCGIPCRPALHPVLRATSWLHVKI